MSGLVVVIPLWSLKAFLKQFLVTALKSLDIKEILWLLLTEPRDLWLSDASASHAGACAESPALWDAAERLPEEAASGWSWPAGCRKQVNTLFLFMKHLPGFTCVFSIFSRIFRDYRHSSYSLQQRHQKIRRFEAKVAISDPSTTRYHYCSALRRTWRSCWRYTRCLGRRRTLSTPRTNSSKRDRSWSWQPGTPRPWRDTSSWWEKLINVSSCPGKDTSESKVVFCVNWTIFQRRLLSSEVKKPSG